MNAVMERRRLRSWVESKLGALSAAEVPPPPGQPAPPRNPHVLSQSGEEPATWTARGSERRVVGADDGYNASDMGPVDGDVAATLSRSEQTVRIGDVVAAGAGGGGCGCN